ncbi:MAG TPA: hypothetical protein ENI42_07345 [Thermoplasmatales archaeon]|nr:hypothetical protein [Thermoplasmatales archaeon]
MKNEKRIMTGILLLISIFILLSGCEERNPVNETEKDLSKLLLTISTNKPSYQTNETVKIILTATNTGDSNITLTFPDAQVADFEILNEEENQVYLWSSGRVFAQVITKINIPSGETLKLLNETWVANSKEGNYTIRGWLQLSPRVYSNVITIRVQ